MRLNPLFRLIIFESSLIICGDMRGSVMHMLRDCIGVLIKNYAMGPQAK